MKKIILISLLLTMSLLSHSQLAVELGAKKTELGNGAITIGISYLKSLDSIFGGQELFVPGKRSWFMVVPELDVVAGTEDATSSIILKASGLFNVFKTKEVSGLKVPDNMRTSHSFPVSLGMEATQSFNNVNGIFEVGWTPYYQSYARNTPEFIKRSRFGIFLQTGYKFNLDSSGLGGKEFASQEQNKRGIARGRGYFSLDTDAILKLGALNVGLVGVSEAWYDIINSQFYYRLDGRARVYLTPDQYFDIIWSRGSSAPLFNNAEQIGVGTVIKF